MLENLSKQPAKIFWASCRRHKIPKSRCFGGLLRSYCALVRNKLITKHCLCNASIRGGVISSPNINGINVTCLAVQKNWLHFSSWWLNHPLKHISQIGLFPQPVVKIKTPPWFSMITAKLKSLMIPLDNYQWASDFKLFFRLITHNIQCLTDIHHLGLKRLDFNMIIPNVQLKNTHTHTSLSFWKKDRSTFFLHRSFVRWSLKRASGTPGDQELSSSKSSSAPLDTTSIFRELWIRNGWDGKALPFEPLMVEPTLW